MESKALNWIGGIVFLFVAFFSFYYLYSKPLIYSYDFKGEVSRWNINHISNIPDNWSVESDYDHTNDINFFNIERSDSFEDGGVLGFSRDFDLNVSKLEHLYIKTNVRVINHSLEGSGFYDDTISGGAGEYPLTVWITYKNINGNESKRFTWGFLTKKNINKRTNYDLVNPGEWHTFISKNLKDVVPDMGVITNISIVGRGWDFHSNIGGKFEIFKSKPSFTDLRFKASISSDKLPLDVDMVSINNVNINVILAETPDEKERGLSNLESISPNQGMLFVYDVSDRHTIWMKEMKFPIDVIWIDESFFIVDFKENIDPASFPEAYTPLKPARYILELNSGFINKHKIKIEDVVKLNI